ncbi:MAG: CRISPR-associated RAMP protein Csx7 [Candidatus Poribacteria bacterium]|nr:CRISPR-associated RAMP protein Csx7 [Candidatus Poribacteria bacterium]
MFDKFQSRLNLKGTVETQTAIRVGAGRSTAVVGSDLPVVRDVEGAPYIPGSSFKGVLRSYVESILRSLTEKKSIVCNPVNHNEQCITKEKMETLKKEQNDQLILDNTCWVCQIFGSLWYASKLQIRDLYVPKGQWFGQFQQRDGVAIDRDTETAVGGHLYDFEVVPAGTLFDFQVIVDNASDWQLGMLYLGLSAFEKGDLTIGGASSRGLGVITLTLDSANYIDRTKIMDYLTADYEGDDAQWESWVKAFKDRIEAELEGTDAQTDG